MPDADKYGDKGSATLPNIGKAVGGLQLPALQALGLGNIVPIAGVPPRPDCRAAWGKMAEKAAGKDTTTGHWEMMGLILTHPFPVYPAGFPPEVIEPFEKKIGKKVLGNKVASGTEIIAELGEEHMATGRPIVYTSADSVFQIAAHEEVVGVDRLYEWCEIARALLQGKHAVGRVIARPFVGEPGNFRRTERRRDYSLPPLQPTLLDVMVENDLPVFAVGKIEDIFAGRGITQARHTKNNMETVDATLEFMEQVKGAGLIFANCVDFDMLWGHRNDVEGYAHGLEALDRRLPEILDRLRPRDFLVITADHGCDPTTESTDHSREYVPLLVAGPQIAACTPLGTRQTFADVAATIADIFHLPWTGPGTSFASQLEGGMLYADV